jgi:hypothetical protein
LFEADETGVIAIAGPPQADTLAVTAPGYRPAFIPGPRAGQTYEVTLERATRAVITCRDRMGRAVAGLRFALSMRPMPIGEDDAHAADALVLPSGDSAWSRLVGETDAYGVARVDGLRQGRWFVSLQHPSFVILGGLDRPWVDVSATGIDLDLICARCFVAVARVEDPDGVVVGSILEAPVEAVVPTRFNPWVLGVAERLQRRLDGDLCEAIVFARDPEPGASLPVPALRAVLRLADSGVHEADVPVQDPSVLSTATPLRPRLLKDPSGLGTCELRLRDVRDRAFDARMTFARVESRASELSSYRTNRVVRMTPGRYRLVDIPAARLWMSRWDRSMTIRPNEHVVFDALIPTAARPTQIGVESASGGFPVVSSLLLSAAGASCRYDLLGQDAPLILPEDFVRVTVERRRRGAVIGVFDVVPSHDETEGRIRIVVDG